MQDTSEKREHALLAVVPASFVPVVALTRTILYRMHGI